MFHISRSVIISVTLYNINIYVSSYCPQSIAIQSSKRTPLFSFTVLTIYYKCPCSIACFLINLRSWCIMPCVVIISKQFSITCMHVIMKRWMGKGQSTLYNNASMNKQSKCSQCLILITTYAIITLIQLRVSNSQIFWEMCDYPKAELHASCN